MKRLLTKAEVEERVRFAIKAVKAGYSFDRMEIGNVRGVVVMKNDKIVRTFEGRDPFDTAYKWVANRAKKWGKKKRKAKR